MIVTTKEQVFEIMGKYYGNAYWREAIKYGYTEEKLIFLTQILDEINALGYNFSNLQRLSDHDDERFLPIALKYIKQQKGWGATLLSAFHCRSYYEYTPELIYLYQNPAYEKYKWEITGAILQIRHKKFIPRYLEIVNASTYGEKKDLFIELLCLLKAKEVLPRLIELYQRYPDEWRWDLLKYGWYFKDVSIIPYIEPYLTCDDGEYRSMAKKAMQKLSIVSD